MFIQLDSNTSTVHTGSNSDQMYGYSRKLGEIQRIYNLFIWRHEVRKRSGNLEIGLKKSEIYILLKRMSQQHVIQVHE